VISVDVDYSIDFNIGDEIMRTKQSILISLGIASAFLILAMGSAAAIEAPAEEWNMTFGGTDGDYVKSVQQTSDGGYILGGDIGNSVTVVDAWLIKTNEAGVEQWNKTFGGTHFEHAKSVQQTADGGFVLAGDTVSFGAGSADAWLIKTNETGVEQWNKTFGGTEGDYIVSVQQTSDGGYILAGTTDSFGAGNSDVWLIKTNETGVEQWNMTFGGTEADFGSSVQQTSDGGYILAGTTDYFGNSDAWLIKTNETGVEQWNKTFGGTDTDNRGHSVQQTSDGGFVLAGTTRSFGNSDGWLIKTNETGVEQWNMTFGGTEADYVESVQQTSDGGYILAGITFSFGAGDADGWLIKVAGTVSPTPIDEFWDAIDELWDEIDELWETLSGEEAARIAADNQLQANITAEEAARIAADNQLQANITAEEAARIAADESLKEQFPQFGEWVVSSFEPGTEYPAETDGFVVCYISSNFADSKEKESLYVEGYTNCSSSGMDLVVADCITPTKGLQYASINMPVREGDRWKVETNNLDVVIRWIPLN